MKSVRRGGIVAAFAMVAATLTLTGSPADAGGVWTNCTSVNRQYPHGVGRVHAHDHTSGTPVTNFRRSNRLFAIAMDNNRGLDRDGDKIACEKR